MRHRNRIHVPGGTYYAIRKSKPPHKIFEQPDDYLAFEEHLIPALSASGTKLIGYCWMPDAIHLVLRVARRPVADLMRRLTRYCVRRMRERSGVSTSPFAAGFPTILIDPDAYLAQLIHYLHFVPVLAGAAGSPDEYAYTSRAAYRGAPQRLPVHIKDLLAHGQTTNCPTPHSELAAILPDRPSDSTCELLTQCERFAPPILGNSEFISRLPRRIRERFTLTHETPSLDEIVDFVAQSHGISRQEIVSSRRHHMLVVTRAQIAWLASEFGVASLSEIARCLRRDPSSLGRAVSHHLRAAPELF